MKPIKNLLQLLILALFLTGVLVSPVFAGNTFDNVGDAMDSELKAAVQTRKTTAKEVAQKRQLLIRKLADVKTHLEEAQKDLVTGREQLKRMATQRDELQKQISARLAGKEELEAIVKDTARNLLGRAEKSPCSAEYPEIVKRLKSILEGGKPLGMEELEALLNICFTDMEHSTTKNHYIGKVLDRNGETVESDITRLGHMAALYQSGKETGYLTLSPISGRLVMAASPPLLVRKNLNKYLEGETSRVYLDISGGIAIAQLSRKTGWMDQLKSGGILVIPILLVGLVALCLTVERLIFLGRVRHNTDELMTRVTDLVALGDFKAALAETMPHRKRPTGRVLMAGLDLKGESETVVESALSEAILKETPRLERFLSALKVSAAIAPLLGLLGTVTGMINTFQVITTHGTGDPRLMAGGISEAMVTTQVGLAVAIPIMIISAFLSRRAQSLARDMEEKGLALMAALLKLGTNGK